MSKENVQMFFKLVETDETLRTRYQTFLKGLADARVDEKSAIPEIVEFAGQHGVHFSAEDLVLVAHEMDSRDLTDEQLNGVVGAQYSFRPLPSA